MKILIAILVLLVAGPAAAGCLFGVCTDRDSCIADLIGDGIGRRDAVHACRLRFPKAPRSQADIARDKKIREMEAEVARDRKEAYEKSMREVWLPDGSYVLLDPGLSWSQMNERLKNQINGAVGYQWTFGVILLSCEKASPYSCLARERKWND